MKTNLFIATAFAFLMSAGGLAKAKINKDLNVSFNETNSLATMSLGKDKISFETKLPTNFQLEAHKVKEVQSTVLFYYQFSDAAIAGSRIIAFDKKKNKEIWRYDVASFNLDIPLANEDFAYITAVGHISKLNLKTGKAVWNNETLNEKQEISDIDSFEKDNGNIILNKEFIFSDESGEFSSKKRGIASELNFGRSKKNKNKCGKLGKDRKTKQCRTLKQYCSIWFYKNRKICKKDTPKITKNKKRAVDTGKRSCSRYGRGEKSKKCRNLSEWCALTKNKKETKCKAIAVKPKAKSSGGGSTKVNGGVFPLPKCRGLKNGGGAGHYGARRRSGKRVYAHTGIDWYSKPGTPIRSPWPGKVIASTYVKRAGYLIKIKHSNGMVTKYFHVGKNRIASGAKVKAGQKIGVVGTSGNAHPKWPHLHFELIDSKGRRVNPAKTFGCTWASGI